MASKLFSKSDFSSVGGIGKGVYESKLENEYFENYRQGGWKFDSGRWIPIDSVKIENYLKIIFIGLGIWVILSRIILTRHIWLVHVVYSWVKVIRVKWGRSEIWIHIMIERIVVKIYFTIYKKRKQTNKQTNKEKEKENKPMLGLT